MSEITLVVKSEYDDTVAVITNGTRKGAIIGVQYEEERMGGITTASFNLVEGTDVPLYTGMSVLLQENGVPVAIFDIDGNPDNRGSGGIVEVNCKGLSARLKKAIAGVTLEGLTLKAAALALADACAVVGITVEADDIALPTDITVAELEAAEETVFDLIELLVTYANGAGLTDKYAWKIAPNKHLVIYDTELIPIKTMYEGYGFQSPAAEVSNSDQANVIKLWRKPALGGDSEYVGTYSDDASVDKYGTFELRVDLDYFAETSDCVRIAQGLLARYARPARTISISGLPGLVSFGRHRLFLRPISVWSMLYAGENKSVLELSHSSGLVIEDSPSSLVGRYSTKCTLNPGAFGYVALPISPPVLLPQRVRLFIKGTAGAECRIILVDVDGDTAQAFITCDGTWKQLTIPLDDYRRTKYALTMRSPIRLHDIDETEAPFVFMPTEDDDEDEYEGVFSGEAEATSFADIATGPTDYAVEMKDPDDNENYTVFMPARGSITSLAEIRFQWITGGVEFWFDYVDCLANQWQAETIGVSKTKVSLKHDAFISEVEFGDGVRTAADELTDVWSVLRRKR